MRFVLAKHSSVASSSLLPIFIILLSLSAEAAKGTFPALFSFGDSILDTGNNNNLITVIKCNFPPYGKDFIQGKPTGRWCDGKAVTDLIAEGLGIKQVVPAYLDPNLQSEDLPTGVCFASAGSGLDVLTSTSLSVISIKDQLNNFKEYMEKLKGVVGEESSNTIISNSLFLLSAGNNDIAITYSLTQARSLQYDPSSYASLLVSWTSDFIKDLYGLGVRKMAVFSTITLGCLPLLRTVLGGILRECAENTNQLSESFNSKLLAELNNLSTTLPHAKIVYIDVYNPLLELIKSPAGSGFENADRGCCGTGTIEFGPSCNHFNLLTCANASQYVFFDAGHPTERSNKNLSSQILKNLEKNFS